MNQNRYLLESRLPEVLALIQVLAYDRITSRSEGGLSTELQSSPSSSDSWISLAKEHPEFFRVRNDEEKKDKASLVSRFVLKKIENTNNKPVLETNTVNKLMEIAIEIHDRQNERRDRWKLYTPIIVAVIAASVKIIVS